MTATLLVNELSNLISEAKRKNNDLRNAAEKSLQELRSLSNTSEQQLAADLSRRPTFIEPFLIACGTRNLKFANSAVICLQRLVISKGLPKARLNEALDAFNACTELNLDIQLKILQALPSLLQNYADDLRGELLSGALQVCTSLQSAKVQTISGVAAATLQQLVTAVFEKVVLEDRNGSAISPPHEIHGNGESFTLRPAAFDAYRVFRDLVLTAEERQRKFVQFKSLSIESSLELVWSSMNANPRLFESHPELKSVIRSNLLPLVTRALSEQLTYPVTVRYLRLLNLILSRYMLNLSSECEVALGLMTRNLDLDGVAPWKRALIMETIRNVFTNGSMVIEAYTAFDYSSDGKKVIQNVISAFVRLSSEKPAAIGLGHQSTAPTGSTSLRELNSEQAVVDAASGMAGVIGSALGVTDAITSGISSQWSIPRTACLEQLDKSEPPALPETYIYALVLECLNGLSDCLARTILPLTVHNERTMDDKSEQNGNSTGKPRTSRMSRSQSFRKRAVPLNPLDIDGSSVKNRVRAVADLILNCWPAILATSSTFLNAALEDQYYRNLIKAFQRFTQVAGLLRLTTPRDALMTTLSKSAVPPHVLNAFATDDSKSPTAESPRIFSNPKSLLSVESLVSQASSLSIDRDKRTSVDMRPTLTTRNLLCLRALLNLAIALGPTLDSAFAVVVDALRQADVILSTLSPLQMARQGSIAAQKGTEAPAVVQAFGAEIAAVEAAASRLLESTADYPNESFVVVLRTFCRLLTGKSANVVVSSELEPVSSPPTPKPKPRTFSGLPGISMLAELQARDYQFVIPKLGSLAELNISRFISGKIEESGWIVIVDELAEVASNMSRPREARQASTDILCKMAAGTIEAAIDEGEELRSIVQQRALTALLKLINQVYSGNGELTSTDLEIQSHVLENLRLILDRCGESMVAGWNQVVAIISSAFERDESTSAEERNDVDAHINWNRISDDLVSVEVGRLAFAATQLLCSDFLASLPLSIVPSLIEILSRFINQSNDINVALTTVNMAWNLSDFLFKSVSTEELDLFATGPLDLEGVDAAIETESRGSRPSQTLMLLLRLRDATQKSQKEVRKATFQTICSIFTSHGNQLSPATWDLLLRVVLMKLAVNDAKSYLEDTDEVIDENSGGRADEEMSKVIINGASEVIAQHIRLIEQIVKLPSLWEVFLNALETYLDAESQNLNAAVYSALSRVLSQIDRSSTVWTAPGYRTIALWLKRVPGTSDDTTAAAHLSNQEAFVAYADTATELYRLTMDSMGTSQLRKMIDNLCFCIQHSDGPRYGGASNAMSPLQVKVLALLKDLRTDLPNIPSRLISAAAQLTVLHHETIEVNYKAHSLMFVALADNAVEWLQTLVATHSNDPEIWNTGALLSALQALRRLIAAKYASRAEYKGLPLWQRATTATLTLSKPIIEAARHLKLESSTKSSLWAEYVEIAGGIMKANGLQFITDPKRVFEDQLRDIESCQYLENALLPLLGDPELPDQTRSNFCRFLFEASLVHPTEPGEIPEAKNSPLENIHSIRRGRVKQIPYSRRERLCYVCFSRLISLASSKGDPTEHTKLAQAATPLLILRLAIPIRGYIADQPMRGRRPQPLSEREELLFCLEQIRKLELDSRALAEDPVAADHKGEKAHLRFLYPLLVKAIATAGDGWSGSEKILEQLRAVLDTIVPTL